MRLPAMVIGVGLTLVGCGGSPGSSSETLPAPATSAPPGATTLPGLEVDVSTTTMVPVVAETTQPGTAPGGGSDEPRTGLSIEQALLPDDAFPPPWEPQWRQVDQPAYRAGPNQTDCDAYWVLEELRGGGGGHAMWWTDGGNANHYVTRVDDDEVALLLELTTIAQQCPTVRWYEGGSFTIERIELDDAIGLKLTDEASGEVTWLAVTGRADVVSVLDVPLWVRADGEMIEFGRDELDRLADLMHQRLDAADLVPLSTTTTVGPTTTVAPTTNVSPTTTVIASTSPPATTAPSPVTGLGKLLLGEEHLPAEFATPRLRTHQPDPSDPDLIESCPAASSVDRIDVMLTWSSTAEGDQIELGQFIGRADSSAEASEVVSLFGEVGSCDLSESFGEEVETTGGEAAISGADAAANLVIRPIDGSFLGEMIVVAVGDVVMIVSVGTTFGSDWEGDPPLDLDLADEIAEIALAKVRAAGR